MKHSMLIILVALSLSSLSLACKSQGGANGTGVGDANANAKGARGEVYATPPFQTREPERYQARMLIRFGPDEETQASETFIMRDADKRREDYRAAPGLTVSDLQTGAGHFLLLPEAKMYAEVTGETEGLEPEGSQPIPPEDFKPEHLINESRAETRYERLGVEELNGRKVTKYRVSVVDASGESQGAQNEQLLWIDEQLGMPVRSETVATGTGGGGGAVKYSMEMLDIKEEADASAFSVPQDYKRVSMKEIQARIARTREPERSEKARGAQD